MEICVIEQIFFVQFISLKMTFTQFEKKNILGESNVNKHTIFREEKVIIVRRSFG